MALIFNYNDMLQKVTMQRTSNFHVLIVTERTQLNATHAQLLEKNETDCFRRNVPFSNDPIVRISRNLAKK